LIITLVLKKNANFFAENWEKSQKIVIITSPNLVALIPKAVTSRSTDEEYREINLADLKRGVGRVSIIILMLFCLFPDSSCCCCFGNYFIFVVRAEGVTGQWRPLTTLPHNISAHKKHPIKVFHQMIIASVRPSSSLCRFFA
jgi:hypothetical protein